MGRLTAAFASLALAFGLALGAAAWMRAALAAERERGHAHGLAVAQTRAAELDARRNALAQENAERTQAAILALEDERDRLQERMNDLQRQTILKDAAPRAGAGDPVCLEPSLVRALDAIRRPALRAGARP